MHQHTYFYPSKQKLSYYCTHTYQADGKPTKFTRLRTRQNKPIKLTLDHDQTQPQAMRPDLCMAMTILTRGLYAGACQQSCDFSRSEKECLSLQLLCNKRCSNPWLMPLICMYRDLPIYQWNMDASDILLHRLGSLLAAISWLPVTRDAK